MENATKALLMGGAILIAILLISVGIVIFQSTEGVRSESETSMNAMAVNAFNSKFVNYIGNDRSAAQVRILYSAIIANNAKNTAHQIKLTGITSLNDITGLSYNVTATYDDKTGYIVQISVANASSGGTSSGTVGGKT